MPNKTGKTFLIFSLVAGLYYLTLLVFGQRALEGQLVKDSNATFKEYRWTDKVAIVGNVNVKAISRVFEGEGLDIQTIQLFNRDEMAGSFFTDDRYNYLIICDSKYSPFIRVQESERMNEYVADWEKRYLWCFVVWIPVGNRMKGIS